MIEVLVHPRVGLDGSELLVRYQERRTLVESDRRIVHDGRHCALMARLDPAAARAVLARFPLPGGVLVEDSGRLIIDTDQDGQTGAVLLMAAAIERFEVWCIDRDEGNAPPPRPMTAEEAVRHAEIEASKRRALPFRARP